MRFASFWSSQNSGLEETFFEVLYLFLSVIDFKDTPVTGPGDGQSPAVVLSVVQTLRLLLFLLVKGISIPEYLKRMIFL